MVEEGAAENAAPRCASGHGEYRKSASSARARWATASPMSARWPGFDVMLNDVARSASPRGIATINGNWRARSRAAHQRGAQGGAQAHRAAKTLDALGDCDLVIEAATENEETSSARSSPRCVRAQARRHRRHQHLVDLDHAAGRLDRPAGALHRHAFHESGAADELVELIRGIATDDATFERPSNSSPSSASRSRCRRISRPSSSTASCCR
jgi:hypothetical protein